MAKTAKRTNAGNPNDDVIKDWADKLAASPPVSRVRLLVRRGRTGDWSLVRGVSVTIPELPGNSITSDDLEGMAAEFQERAEEHFATLTTTLGAQAKRADYKLEALHFIEDKELPCWESAVYTIDHSKPTERDVAVERGMQDVSTTAQLSDQFIRVIGGLTTLTADQFTFTNGLNAESNRRLRDAHSHDLARYTVEADERKAIKAEEVRLEIALDRNRTVRHFVNSFAPLARRGLDLALIYATRRPGPRVDQTPDTLQGHCAYVAEHYDLIAPLLATGGVNDEIIHALHDACALGGNAGEFSSLIEFRARVTIPAAQLRMLAETVARMTGDRQLAESLFAVMTWEP